MGVTIAAALNRIAAAALVLAVCALGVVMLVPAGVGSAEPAFPACTAVDPDDAQLVARGRTLFHRRNAFAQDGPFPACATCHRGAALTDNRNHLVAPTGNASVTFRRSTPSLLQNLGATAPYLWDGRTSCAQRVVLGAIESPVEMGGRVPRNEQGQAQLDALVAFVLSLDAPKPPPGLDRAAVRRGGEVFRSKPCATCHSGDDFTDNLLHDHRIGGGDPGAELVGTGGRGAFNTPGLRGVRVSAPYFHDGRNGVPLRSAETVQTEPRKALLQVVEFYDEDRDLGLTDRQKRDLVEFLMSLGREDEDREDADEIGDE